MKRILLTAVLFAACAVFAGGIDRVTTVGTASIQEKRRVRNFMTPRVVGKTLIPEEVEKIVGELSLELEQKGYSVKLAYVPKASVPGTVTVSVDFVTRTELRLRQKAAGEGGGASGSVVSSRRPSRWLPSPGGEIKRVRVRGDVDFCDQYEIQDLIEEELKGKTLTADNEKQLLDAARVRIVRKGFPLATVTAGEGSYNARNGLYIVNVDPGRFGDVRVHFGGETNSWFHSNAQVMRKVKGLNKGDIFTLEALNDTMRVLNNNPDYRVHAGVEVIGEDAKVGDIVLNVDDDIPIHGNVEVNNYGMEDIGKWQFTGALQITNLTRHDDVLTVSPGLSERADLWWISGGYLLPYEFWRGGYLSVYGGYSDLKSEEVLPSFDLIGSGWYAGSKLSVNLLDNLRRTISVDFGVMYRDSKDSFDIEDITQYTRNARTMPATVALVYADKKGDALGGRFWADLQFLFNTYHDGNRLSDYVYGAENHYYVGSFDVARHQALTDIFRNDVPEWKKWSVFAKVHGSWTDQTLTSNERAVLGGNNTVRGYRTRGYSGDWGFNGTLELRTPIWTDPEIGLFMDRENCMPITRWQFVAFADAGWLKYNNYENYSAYYDETEWLVSAGLGLRLSITRYFQLGADFAVPLRKAYLDKYDNDYEFYLSSRLQF